MHVCHGLSSLASIARQKETEFWGPKTLEADVPMLSFRATVQKLLCSEPHFLMVHSLLHLSGVLEI